MSALNKQVGGDHYKQFPIQPVEFCHVNKIPYLEATAIKYLCRWRDKGGLADLDKAIHFIELLKEFEGRGKVPVVPYEEPKQKYYGGISYQGDKNVNSAP
jgi:hypothetical protein